jgi:hypothetical protein
MVEATFRTLLMLAARGTYRGVPPVAPTRRGTVDVAPIARPANAEGPGAAPARADTEGKLHGPQRRAHGLETPRPDRGTMTRLIRPAAASSRSRGPGGCCSRSSPSRPAARSLPHSDPRHASRGASGCSSLGTAGPRTLEGRITSGGSIQASNPGSIPASAEDELVETITRRPLKRPTVTNCMRVLPSPVPTDG